MPKPNHRGGGREKKPASREVTISKSLSLLLRHAAEREGLKINSDGYANVADVVCPLFLPKLPDICKLNNQANG